MIYFFPIYYSLTKMHYKTNILIKKKKSSVEFIFDKKVRNIRKANKKIQLCPKEMGACTLSKNVEEHNSVNT